MERKQHMTKIVATIGPASASENMLRKLILAGVNVTRLNFSHGTHEEHLEVIKRIRKISHDLHRPVGILLDLQGPKIRTGKLKNPAGIQLKKGANISISPSETALGDEEEIYTTYKGLHHDVKVGDVILIDDGLIRLEVERVLEVEKKVLTRVLVGGLLKEHKGINLPGVKVSEPSVTKKDKEDIAFGVKHGVDFFALSFVREASDVLLVKKMLKGKKSDIPVIAKIEKPEAVSNIDQILAVADGVMVARGDLGVELSAEVVPVIQKVIILKAIKANKVVITATQMLESMTKNPIPTRAEASDVANAIYDGSDAVMLSGETASGHYPLQAVEMMMKIIAKAESSPFMNTNMRFEKDSSDIVMYSIAHASVDLLRDSDSSALVTFSMSGKTPKLISKQRPARFVYAFSTTPEVQRRLSLVWGVIPLYLPLTKDAKKMLEQGEKIILQERLQKKGELVVVVTGLAMHKGATNVIKLHRLGVDE